MQAKKIDWVLLAYFALWYLGNYYYNITNKPGAHRCQQSLTDMLACLAMLDWLVEAGTSKVHAILGSTYAIGVCGVTLHMLYYPEC